ncbi:MAG: NAD(P)/FAD-dependent oxidoreductase [Ignavibacteriales bacterium]|nr:NAD(P)/FAD-dependent oxidoreductase [Ignavibacteriales bacterium]
MNTDVIIIGAGAAGLMCAIEAGKRGRSVLVVDHNKKIGEKIRISGGGKCNFTNRNVNPSNFISQNPHFCKSALARYTPTDFISLIEKHCIHYHERKHGQLFCDGSAEQIIHMLVKECQSVGVTVQTDSKVKRITQLEDGFELITDHSTLITAHLVIATGGLSIPKMGATNYGLKIAEQFGINIIPPKPGLVPLKFDSKDFNSFQELSGVSLDAEVSYKGISFRENILLTHRGLSGPAILQISSYWNPGDSLSVNLLPDIDALDLLKTHHHSKKQPATILEQFLPASFTKAWFAQRGESKPMNRYSTDDLKSIAASLTNWLLVPTGTEGYAKAEVTIGGVDTNELSSKTMESKRIPGLFFIGEVVDVSGWLGGYNFQWAWSSGWAAGQVV